MKPINYRNALRVVLLTGAAIMAGQATAQPEQNGFSNGYGMGYGMMQGYGGYPDENLTADQRRKINEIQNGLRRKHWELMGKILDEQAKMNDLYYAVPRDDTQISKIYRKISDLRQQMFELSLNAQRQVETIINKKISALSGRIPLAPQGMA